MVQFLFSNILKAHHLFCFSFNSVRMLYSSRKGDELRPRFIFDEPFVCKYFYRFVFVNALGIHPNHYTTWKRNTQVWLSLFYSRQWNMSLDSSFGHDLLDDLSFNVLSVGKMLFDELSVGEMLFDVCLFDNFLFNKLSFSEMSFGKISFNDCPFNDTYFSMNCQLVKCLLRICCLMLLCSKIYYSKNFLFVK